MRTWITVAALTLVLVNAAGAATIFNATITGGQEVGPVVTNASGVATLTLNNAQDRLEVSITITGLDLDGLQTPLDASDDILGMHIHAAPAGINGGVVFGFISPSSDTNGDLVIDPIAGTVNSAWDLAEGNGTTLGAQLANLLSEGLYINVHTPARPGGEIRGQIVPEPASVALLLSAIPLVLRRR